MFCNDVEPRTGRSGQAKEKRARCRRRDIDRSSDGDEILGARAAQADACTDGENGQSSVNVAPEVKLSTRKGRHYLTVDAKSSNAQNDVREKRLMLTEIMRER